MLKVVILWHMHQPYYRDPASGNMMLPWVRLHGLKDYGDLPIRLKRFERLKMTFNLVPSLIEQLNLYCDGKTTDRHLQLTQKPTGGLERQEKAEIFDTFFTANPATMIEPFPRYRRLFRKLQDCNMDAELAARTSSQQEIRDLTVWSNLVWVDPVYHSRDPFRYLFAKGEKFTEDDKQALIDAQFEILADIVPTYRSLMETGRIEVSFSPYFHPILPLLCDTDSAKEALPGITLPKNRFCHPGDAERQVALAVDMYRDIFGRDPLGMWPSEGSISEQMAPILVRHNIRWMASDEKVLYGSLMKSGLPSDHVGPHAVFRFDTSEGPVNIFFRDHALSDRIGFVYAAWEAEKAVDDFMKNLHSLAETLAGDGSDAVVPVILDGENCWEYYPNDGDDFLQLLFERLDSDRIIETMTMAEAVAAVTPRPLKHIQAGSWINRNFRIWIGHPEDNTAWDLLWEARKTLTDFKKAKPEYDPEKIARAEKSLMAAEGSDWNWWYGDEHRGGQNDIFDRIYRTHLASVYTELGLKIPRTLLSPISSALPESYITEPEGVVTPVIDGRLTHYYEWLGAGKFDCLKAGGAMHRAEPRITQIGYVSDHDSVYLRVDFAQKGFLVDNEALRLKVEIISPGQGSFVFGPKGIESAPEWAGDAKNIVCGIGEIAEIGMKKKMFFPEGHGEIFFRVGIFKDDEKLELWPEGDPIRFHFAGRDEEIIWDL